jgi:hypothetical protein
MGHKRSAPFSWSTQKRGLLLPRRAAALWEGNQKRKGGTGKQKPRSCKAQELASSRPRKGVAEKKGGLLNPSKNLVVKSAAAVRQQQERTKRLRSGLSEGRRHETREYPLIARENEPTRIRSKGCQDLFLFQMILVNWLMWTAGCLRHLVHGG